VLAAVALAQLIAGGLQALWTGSAVRVAKRAADAADRSAEVAERSLVQLQRALVVPTNFVVTTIVNRQNRIIGYMVTAHFQNTGNTPAKRFTGTANTYVLEGTLPEDFRYPDRVAADPAHGTVGPRVIVPYPISIAIQDIVDIQQGRKKGFMYGWVEYSDIFESTKRRRTEFCVRIEVNGDPTVLQPAQGGPSVLGIGVHGKYNSTDEDCVYQPGERPPVGDLPPPTQPPRP
jgi:hypothetical protein